MPLEEGDPLLAEPLGLLAEVVSAVPAAALNSSPSVERAFERSQERARRSRLVVRPTALHALASRNTTGRVAACLRPAGQSRALVESPHVADHLAVGADLAVAI